MGTWQGMVHGEGRLIAGDLRIHTEQESRLWKAGGRGNVEVRDIPKNMVLGRGVSMMNVMNMVDGMDGQGFKL